MLYTLQTDIIYGVRNILDGYNFGGGVTFVVSAFSLLTPCPFGEFEVLVDSVLTHSPHNNNNNNNSNDNNNSYIALYPVKQ